MILDGVLPLDYNYTDIPLLSGTFLNATHIQDCNTNNTNKKSKYLFFTSSV